MMKKLGFGCMWLPILGAEGGVDIPQFSRMADEFLAHGFTYFDTSYVYHGGKSEDALRQALVERHSRGSFTITTKLPVFLESYDFSGKTVIPFDTNGGSGLADTVSVITKACPGATVKDLPSIYCAAGTLHRKMPEKCYFTRSA